jgi:hypothetical protein
MKKMTNAFNTTVAVVAITASTVFSGGAVFAATDGTLGTTSTGTTDISVTKTKLAQISALTDLTIASYTLGGGDQHMESTACIYSSSVNGGYRVTATGSGATNAFTLDDGASHTIAYTVIWNSGGVGALGITGAALTTNVQTAALTGAAMDSATCAGAVAGPTAQLNVNILGSVMDAAPAGTYTGTLTVVVAPV